MISRLGLVLPMAFLLFAAVPSEAQQRTSPFQNASALVANEVARPAVPLRQEQQQQQQQEEVKPEDEMGTSGFFLGIIGMLAGAAVGSQLGQSACPAREIDKDCMSNHAYTGALVAGTILTPLGVHLANKQPKNLALAMGVSALTGTALYYGFKAIPGSPIAMAPFIAAPLQVFMTVKLERRK